MVPSAPPAVASSTAFHAHVDVINQRRLLPLTFTIMVLLGVAALNNYFIRGRFDPTESNFLGMLLGVAQSPLYFWRTSTRLRTNIFGLTIVGWGVTSASIYVDAVFSRNAGVAAAALVAYFTTRVLVSLSLVWRPIDLAVLLAIGYAVSAPVLGAASTANAYVLTPIWTFVSWLTAFMIYRAQRDAFLARAGLERQRDVLAAANLRLEHLNQEQHDLMAIAAHDLRSPLLGITMLVNATAKDAARVWDAGVGRLKAIEHSVQDLATLVSRVLDVHAAEDRIGQLALAAGDVRPLVVRIVDSHRDRATAKQIAVGVEIPAACQAVHDDQALGRVLDNLVSNAVKFTPPGGHVQVVVTHDATGVTITVSDSGPGIDRDERPLLFRKFARLHTRPTGEESSSGLGLYIAKQLTEAMGGSIAIADSASGSTFVVRLAAASL